MEGEIEEETEVLDEDYYSFLNISREATIEEITNAYRRLSKLYHPDKHVDPVKKKEAEVLFNKTKKAYEVLKDEHKRAIYDHVGLQGLETEGWEIIQRTKTAQEIREEYERLARQREERRLHQRTNPKGTTTVNINATELFTSYDYDYEFEESLFPSIEVSGMSIHQSIESPLTSRDTATISGQLNTHNGTGTGAITLSDRHSISEKGWVEGVVGFGNGPLVLLKGFRTLTQRLFANGECHLHFTPNGIRTGVDMSLAMQLDRQMMGYLSWRGGSTSGMSTTIARDTEHGHMSFTLLLGVPHSYISTSYTWKIKKAEMKVRTAVKFGSFGHLLEYGVEKKVSEQSSLGATVSVGVPSGVALKIKLTRASQVYNFVIQMCDEVAPSPVFYATVAPLCSWIILKKLVIDPIVTQRHTTKKERQRQNYKNRLAEKRQEAAAAINLMAVTFERVRGEEEARKGLVVTVGRYGRSNLVRDSPPVPPASTLPDPDLAEVIDVTIPLQCLVKDSKLLIYDSSKSGLPGFYDPCPGEEKALYVQYMFHNNLHETVVLDKDKLRIPRQADRVTLLG